jgi:hypothetical protein
MGVFIANLQIQLANHIYIRATLQETHSVIYVESAAITSAAVVIHRMGCYQVSFFSDCQQLVQLLNSNDLSNLPDWRMAIPLQNFQDYTRDRRSQVLKIDRTYNCTTDTLARLVFSSPDLQY